MNTELIKKAQDFINQNNRYSAFLPKEISAPIIAKFAEMIIVNELNLSPQDLIAQAKVFIIEAELEETYYCLDDMALAMQQFSSSFIQNQTNISATIC